MFLNKDYSSEILAYENLLVFFMSIMMEACLRFFIQAVVFVLCDLENNILKVSDKLPDF